MIVLASTSPRRAALLAEAGIAFEPFDPGVKDHDEEELAQRWRGLAPAQVAKRLAIAKAFSAARKRHRGVVLAADTVVALGDRILGKPRDRADAKAMIELLAGHTHEVTTGVALYDLATGELRAETETSKVSFQKIDAATLESFLASGTWAGKAGAYGVQDEAARPLVQGVEGSRSNVIGLPIERVRALLARVAVALCIVLPLAGCPAKTVPPPPPAPAPSPPAIATNPDPKPEPLQRMDRTPRPEEGLPNKGLPEVSLHVKDLSLTTELATTEAQRRLGLMHRDSMDENRAMLFVYPEEQKDFHNFWMHNTRLPLSLAYLREDGTIVNIEDMEAYDETTKHYSKEKVRLGLEVNKGWFKVHGVVPGDKIAGVTPEILAKGE